MSGAIEAKRQVWLKQKHWFRDSCWAQSLLSENDSTAGNSASEVELEETCTWSQNPAVVQKNKDLFRCKWISLKCSEQVGAKG